MDGFFEDSFKLHDMIENDIRSGRNEFGNYFCSDLSLNPVSHMDINPMDGIDRELSDDGTTGWFNSSHLLNGSTDFDSIGGLMVNPRTALPLSDPVPLSSSVSSSLSESSSISSVSESQASPPSASSSLSASILNHAITSNSDMKDVNLTVDVPTPSPNAHSASSQAQIYSSHDADGQDNTDSPKLKSKNKNSKSNNQNNNENTYPKPAYSYSCLIAMALKNSRTGSLPVNEIYDFMTENFPYFKTAPNGWKNSVRHNLSLNKCFEKIEKPAGNNTQRKGYLWAMNPAKIEKMEEELQKWGSKDPDAIRKSMANPERLELIEKGELRGTDSESEVENMSTSQLDEDEETPVEEKENEVKVQVTNIGNDLLNNDYSALGDSGNIDNCLHELEIQKGMWDNIYDERLQFLTDSPISPLSPKNSETMDDEASLDSPPSSQKAYVQANIIYKCAPRTPTSDPSNRLIAHASSPSKGAACNV